MSFKQFEEAIPVAPHKAFSQPKRPARKLDDFPSHEYPTCYHRLGEEVFTFTRYVCLKSAKFKLSWLIVEINANHPKKNPNVNGCHSNVPMYTFHGSLVWQIGISTLDSLLDHPISSSRGFAKQSLDNLRPPKQKNDLYVDSLCM